MSVPSGAHEGQVQPGPSRSGPGERSSFRSGPPDLQAGRRASAPPRWSRRRRPAGRSPSEVRVGRVRRSGPSEGASPGLTRGQIPWFTDMSCRGAAPGCRIRTVTRPRCSPGRKSTCHALGLKDDTHQHGRSGQTCATCPARSTAEVGSPAVRSDTITGTRDSENQ